MAQTVKNLPAMWEAQVLSLDREDPLEKGMATHSVFLLKEFHVRKSLECYSPWGHKESDMTERLTLHPSLYSYSTLIGSINRIKLMNKKPLEGKNGMRKRSD